MLRSQQKSQLNFPGVSGPENEFLITRLDPFHDAPYNPMGGPGSAPTVVRQYRRTVQLASPSPTSTANWSAIIGTGSTGLQLTNSVVGSGTAGTCYKYQRAWQNGAGNVMRWELDVVSEYGGENAFINYAAGSAVSNHGVTIPIAPLYAICSSSPAVQTVKTVNLTTPATPVYSPATAAGIAMGVAQFGENVYADGPSKLVSIAYEIHMTSSDLYNQGTLTVGRVPQALQTSSTKFNTSATTSTISNTTMTAVLPTNVSELILFQGSRQWPAKYGIYAVAPASSSTIEDFDASPFVSHATRSISWQAASQNVAAVNSVAQLTSTRDATQFLASTEHFDNVITMLEGLHPQSTLTLTVLLTYETIPTDNASLRPLSRRPMPIRSQVMDLYASVCERMEPFCMVAENNNMGFFKKIFGVAKYIIPKIGSGLVKTAVATLPPEAKNQLKTVTQAVKMLTVTKDKALQSQEVKDLRKAYNKASKKNSRQKRSSKRAAARSDANAKKPEEVFNAPQTRN